jgi:4-carboxymuconolactone decarboxylase
MASQEELRAKGRAVMSQLWGERAGKGGGPPGAQIAPEFFDLVTQFCFGGFWSRPGLDVRSRSLVTVAQLAALGRTEELKAHLHGALHLGIRREELVEVLRHTSQYAGIPAAVSALNAAAEILKPPAGS